jgi:hypothetical protein
MERKLEGKMTLRKLGCGLENYIETDLRKIKWGIMD